MVTSRKGRWSAGFVPDEEREQLRATFGETLSAARRAAGLSVVQLAKRSGISESHVYALQAGSSRTRPATIAVLSRVLAPDDADRLEHELTVAAGDSLRPDTPGGSRRRRRRSLRVAKRRPPIEAQIEALGRKIEKLRLDAAARRTVVSGRPLPVPADDVQARAQLAALDVAAERVRQAADAQQWQREQRMMRGERP